MFLRNYDNLRVIESFPCIYSGETLSTDITTFGDGHLNVKNTSGTITNVVVMTTNRSGSSRILERMNYQDGNSYFLSYGDTNIVVGNGLLDVTYDDFSLNNIIPTSDISPVTTSSGVTMALSYDETTNEWTKIVTKKYVAVNDIIINEVGLVTYYPSSYSGRGNALVFREVLSESINVPADHVVAISIAFKVNGNPNSPTVDVSVE